MSERPDAPDEPGGWEPPEGASGGGWQSSWQPPAGAPAQPQQPWGQPAGGLQFQQPGPGESSGKATAALVLGILGIVFCPLVCSIVALVLGYSARKEIDASGGRLGGRGNAQAGIVLGWIGLVIALIGIAALIALAASGELNWDTEIYEDPSDTISAIRALLAVG